MDGAIRQGQPVWALFVVCIGVLMIGLDTTVVTVALPSIVADFRSEHPSLSWVFNAYLLTFGGLLVVAGRSGDLYGRRRIFIWGMCVFTGSSLLCGVARNFLLLVSCRALQGIGAALVSAVSLSLITGLFRETRKRTWALGVYGVVSALGGAIGDVVGGLLTGALNWHWIFLVNVLPGVGIIALGLTLLPPDETKRRLGHLDLVGALLLMSSSSLLIFTIVNGKDYGWTSWQTVAGAGGIALLSCAFYCKERIARPPLIPRTLFRSHGFTVGNLVGALFTAGTFGWFVDSALYLQGVLGYSALKVGLAYLPAEAFTAVFAGGLSTRIIERFGTQKPLCLGLFAVAVGFAVFGRDPEGGYWGDVFPGMVLMGLGAGLAYTPLLMSALHEIPAADSGLSSGILNMAFMLGGAIGVALVANAIGAEALALPNGDTIAVTTTHSYRVGFAISSVLIMGALLFAISAVRDPPRQYAGEAVSIAHENADLQ